MAAMVDMAAGAVMMVAVDLAAGAVKVSQLIYV